MKKILVIGAGASGMMAAYHACKKGNQVMIYEKTDKPGKKILATGNGKCNLTNLNMGTEYYYTEYKEKLEQYLAQFHERDTIDFFESLGLLTRQRDGYVYPYCEQACAVLEVLKNALAQKNIPVLTSVENICIKTGKKGGFVVTSSVGKADFDAVILACGSKAGIRHAATDGYDLAKGFGHKICRLYPALVQVRCKENFFKELSGVRIKSRVVLRTADDNTAFTEQGEVQLTDYGISGIPVFQISRQIAGFLDKKREFFVCLDFFPDITGEEWKNFYEKRLHLYEKRTAEDFLLGMLHKKISLVLLKENQLLPSDTVTAETLERFRRLCDSMKCFPVTPTGVNSFEQAQVCRGGVDLSELDDHLQSCYQKGLYICGEMVDVDGKCGGYNLQWAWTSGYIAGCHAARS